MREHLKLASGRRVVCGISFGYPAHNHIISYRTSRAPLSEAVTFVGE